MDTWVVIVLVVVGALVLLAIGGVVARRRMMDATRDSFEANLERVNEELAEAHAQDRGWEPARLQAAARDAFAEQRPGSEPGDMTLVQVIDRPGTDDDKAVFRIDSGGRRLRLTLGRQGDEWVYERLE